MLPRCTMWYRTARRPSELWTCRCACERKVPLPGLNLSMLIGFFWFPMQKSYLSSVSCPHARTLTVASNRCRIPRGRRTCQTIRIHRARRVGDRTRHTKSFETGEGAIVGNKLSLHTASKSGQSSDSTKDNLIWTVMSSAGPIMISGGTIRHS